MKKIVALLISVSMLFAATAFAAEGIPSKTSADIGSAAVELAQPANTTTVTEGVATEEEGHAIEFAPTEVAETVLEELAQAEAISDYFKNIVDVEDNPVKLTEMLDTDEASLEIHEFSGLTATGFEEGCGDVTATLKFATPFEVDQKVIVLIGVTEENETKWVALEGIGVDSDELGEGCIKVVVPENLVLAVQQNAGLIAIVSDK